MRAQTWILNQNHAVYIFKIWQGEVRRQQGGGGIIRMEHQAFLYWCGPWSWFSWGAIPKEYLALQTERAAHGKWVQASQVVQSLNQ